jgi:DNA-binding response OmpR family regulator
MLTIDTERHEVILDGKEINLTPKEFDILDLLIAADGRVVSRDALRVKVYKERAVVVQNQTIDQHVSRLRGKLGRKGFAYVRSITGKGYRFKA